MGPISKPTCPVCGKNVDWLGVDPRTQKHALAHDPTGIGVCGSCGEILKVQEVQCRILRPGEYGATTTEERVGLIQLQHRQTRHPRSETC
jgi:hypothetical protein